MEQQPTTNQITLQQHETKLRLLLSNHLDSLAIEQIKKFNLPFRVENGELKDALSGADRYLRHFITKDEQMLVMKKHVKSLANLDEEVLIVGETGTGKEIIARALHGDRPGRFLAVNCGGLPENLIESELFGHTANAFTGATKAEPGIMKEARDGTVFFDEIGELPLQVQAKLLRILSNQKGEPRKVRKVGGTIEEEINCRIVCATNKDIGKMSKDGTFRQDLYARISTFELRLKSLRERHGDIEEILLSLEGGKEFITAWSSNKFASLDLTLNVRSLQQVVKRFKVLGTLPIIK
jgi:transcriptional regulator with PAS, ATPase and Fis domain